MKSISELLKESLNESINNDDQLEKKLPNGLSYLAKMDPSEVYDLEEEQLENLLSFINSDEWHDLVDDFSTSYKKKSIDRFAEIETNLASIK